MLLDDQEEEDSSGLLNVAELEQRNRELREHVSQLEAIMDDPDDHYLPTVSNYKIVRDNLDDTPPLSEHAGGQSIQIVEQRCQRL
jgi:hypothetical protein